MALGAVLLVVVRGSRTPTDQQRIRGHRVFRVSARAVQALDVTLQGRRFVARRTASGWEIDGRPAGRATADALEDLVTEVGDLRAVDVFRPRDAAEFGLASPRATVTLRTARGERRVTLGDTNTTGSVLYARRDGDGRVMQVGIGILSGIERVLYQRDREGAPP